MAVARWLETDTNSNKDISAAVSIGAYTADADRMIVCDVSLDQVAGNGDYVIYVTRQINGAGSAYVLLPKTTCAAASGETAIAMQSGPITVRSGDVLTVMVDGLAGDTATPDTTVRWFEMATLRPATADRQLTVAETGEGSANVTMQAGVLIPGPLALEATAQAILEDTGTTLPAAIAAIDTSGMAEAVWEYTTRTLTQSSTSTTDSTAAGSIARRRGDSWSISLTIGAITGYTSLWFTAKWDRDNTDAESVLQVKKNASGSGDGLLYVNGATAANAALGSITVTDATTGAIVIAVDETVTDDLSPAGIYYDVQVLNAGSVSTLDSGTLTISADVTRAVA